MEKRKCTSCGKLFQPKLPHHHTCWDCSQQQRAGGLIGEDYLAKGYFTDPGNSVVSAELLSTEATRIAKMLSDAEVSMGQVRRYFTMARFLKDRLQSGEVFGVVANELRRMKANVAAVVGRVQEGAQRERLTRTLKEFLDRNFDVAVRDAQSFVKGFLPHFECVLAYFVWHNSQRGGRRRGA